MVDEQEKRGKGVQDVKVLQQLWVRGKQFQWIDICEWRL